jgi:epoxyqueuosine reductase QueG
MKGAQGIKRGENIERGEDIKHAESVHLTDALRDVALSCSMTLFGTACFRDCEDLAPRTIPFSLREFPYAVSIGFRLSDPVMDGLIDRPTRTYQYHYRQVNLLIDHTLLRLLGKIHEFGFKGFPVPSSQIVDWNADAGHLAHKVVAFVAGHGWMGRNNLLVSPVYGSRVRYGSLFTNAPLQLAAPAAAGSGPSLLDCGSCSACVDACPAGAIGNTRAEFDLEKCRQALKGFEKSENIGSMICGLCIKACRGQRRSSRW